MNPDTVSPQTISDPHIIKNPAQILIVHDVLGGPTLDWIPNAKKAFEDLGHTVITPALVTGTLASYNLWEKIIRNQIESLTPGSICIGHGVGGTLLLSLLSTYDIPPVSILVLVATPTSLVDHAGYRKLSETFFTTPFDVGRIAQNTKNIIGIYSDNDPFVPFSHSEYLHTEFHTNIINISGVGHMTHADGVDTLTALHSIIESYDQEIINAQLAQADFEKKDRDTRLIAQNIPGLHTMQTDIAELTTQNVSVVGSGLLRQARIEERQDLKNSIKNPKNIVYILLAITCVVGGLLFFAKGAVSLLPKSATMFFKAPDPSLQAPMVIDSIEEVLAIDQISQSQIIPELNTIINRQSTKGNNIVGIPISAKSFPATVESLILYTTGAPAQSDLDPIKNQKVFYGVSLYPNPNPFMIIEIPSYNVGYTMLENWTQTLIRTLGPWMLIDEKEIQKISRAVTTQQVIINNNVITTLFSPEEIIPVVTEKQNPFNSIQVPSDTDTLLSESSVELPQADTNTHDLEFTKKPGEELLSWVFLDEQHILFIRNKLGISEVKKRFHEKQSRIQQY